MLIFKKRIFIEFVIQTFCESKAIISVLSKQYFILFFF